MTRDAMQLQLLLVLAVVCAGPVFAATPTVTVPTSYAQMVQELKRDERRSPLVRVVTIGFSAEKKRPILLVRLGRPGAGAVRILVLCRQHGDEPSGTEGALAVINHLAATGTAARQFKTVSLYIVPMVNPDGAELETRLSGVHADLNRDWGVFDQPETRAVRRAVDQIRPELILDIHSWDMIDPFQQVCLEGPRYSQSIGPKLLFAVADLQARAAYGISADTGQNVAATTYGPDSIPTLAHRYFLHSCHIASLLFETAPGPNYGPSLSARKALVESLLYWTINDTTLHPDNWRRLVAAEPGSLTTTPLKSPGWSPVKNPIIAAVQTHARSPWTPLVLACLLTAWLGINVRRRSSMDAGVLPARYRRYVHTSVEMPIWMLSPGRMGERRKSTEHLSLIAELKNKLGIRSNPR